MPIWRQDGMLTLTAGSAGIPANLLIVLGDDEIYSNWEHAAPGSIVPAGQKVDLRCTSQVEKAVIAESVEGILKLSKAWQREPEVYLVWGNGEPVFYRFGMTRLDDIPEPLKSYHQAIKLWQLLRIYAHHQDGDTDSLWFFGVRKTEIQPGFSLKELSSPLDLSSVASFMEASDATEIRKEILASRIAAHLDGQDPETRFSYLLSSLPRFARGLREQMSIYLCEHSPEKLEEEAKLAAVEFAGKMETIVSGLETKGLTVPIALFLAYKEVNKDMGPLGNSAIVLSAVLYLAGMAWVHFTQSALLDLLTKSIQEKKVDFEKKGLDRDNPVLAKAFKTLEERGYRSEKFSGWMFLLSFLPPIAAIIKWCNL
ncbi:hypothetical protein GCM10023213_08210 [Prosthecobacter algae]|uniref:Uncharacterized protein n=2 Tax=Prosthecobacter algae TaxID=1144682 RepID=A0ABP9NYL8_9BACT